jgi:hypothetical protein
MKTRGPLKRNLILGLVLGIAAVTFFMTSGHGHGPKLELSISRIVDVRDENAVKTLDFRFPIDDPDDDIVVVMKVQNLGGSLVMFGKERIQPRVGGRWLEAYDVSWLNSMYFVATVPARSEEEFVIAVVPRHTESVRLFVNYHEESLIENWHRLCRYQAHTTQYGRFPTLIGGFFVGLDHWIIEPLRRHALAAAWPWKTAEFRLPQLQVLASKERHRTLIAIAPQLDF